MIRYSRQLCSVAVLAVLMMVLLLTILPACKSSNDNAQITVIRQAAEFEDQVAIWIVWPTIDHKWGMSNKRVVHDMVKALIEANQVVNIVVSDENYYAEVVAEMQDYDAHERINIFKKPSYEWWVRDIGPTFVETADGGRAVVNFRFNAWGYTDSDDPEIQIDANFARNFANVFGLPVIESSMISEGGNRELNGRGTLMLTASTEENRNPLLSRAQMEKEYERLFGVKNVIWLEEGLYEDDHTFLGPLILSDGSKAYTVITTHGHVDEFARFVTENTILLARVAEEDLLDDDPIAIENHRRLEINFEILRQARDQDGNPFNIIRVPLNKLQIHTMRPGDYVYDFISTLDYVNGHQFPVGEPVQVIAAASYLNFTITPGVILAQKYGQVDDPVSIARDQEVKQILESVFPGRTVAMIDAIPVNLGGGGIHCITIQEPLFK
jgi:agmatine deiminase